MRILLPPNSLHTHTHIPFQVLDIIAAGLEEDDVACIRLDCNTPQKEKQARVRLFQDTDMAQVLLLPPLLLTAVAAAVALLLLACCCCCYYRRSVCYLDAGSNV